MARLYRSDLTLTRSASTAGWTDSVALRLLGRQGRILTVKLREDATYDDATEATLYLVDTSGTVSAAPDDLDVVYESDTLALAGSATAASLADALPVPAPYAVDAIGNLRAAAYVSVSTGSTTTKLYVTVLAEVWD